VKRLLGVGVAEVRVAAVALLVVGCKAPLRPDLTTSTSAPTPTSVQELAAAVASDSKRSGGESNLKNREELAADATRNADACLKQAPQAAPCLYYHGIALGLEARAHPIHASESLKAMLDALANAEAVDPQYDEAGPARVRALVLVRAPGWPLGPGDTEAGLAAARRAVALQPTYPPNLLALAEALAKAGDANGARENYQRARDLAQARPPGADRDDWLREAEQALQHKRSPT
jgi:tetratricopeptide (TPR) repeat protein